MAKAKQEYRCTACDARFPKLVGCCSQCREWNCVELYVPAVTVREQIRTASAQVLTLKPLTQVQAASTKRMKTGIGEFDRVLGGGIVPGAFVMLTGDPGIGKSTLLLQVSHALAQDHSVLYISSEESLEQVKIRAERINCVSDTLLLSDNAQLDAIIATAYERQPSVLILDSVQNCYTNDSGLLPGSVGQLKEATFKLMRLAKEMSIAVIVTGHITKEGYMAGPKTLEHMVDVVLYLQADDALPLRMVRAVKNRFGTLDEVGFFEMGQVGMQELRNVNAHVLHSYQPVPGAVLASTIEGTRPVLMEMQALLVPTKYGIPQRVITGCDPKQVLMLLALLERHLKVPLSDHDMFFRVGGGCKIRDAGSDLSIALAILSAYFQKPLPQRLLAVGELTLTGHVRPVSRVHMHVAEAEQFGIPLLIIAEQQRAEKLSVPTKRIRHLYDLVGFFDV